MTAPQTLLKAWNLHARKELGQNFLKEAAVAERIASAWVRSTRCLKSVPAWE